MTSNQKETINESERRIRGSFYKTQIQDTGFKDYFPLLEQEK
jgi:hypothetical protein